MAGLRWDDIHDDSITIDERYCRGDWGTPKSDCSNATIAVNRCVVERIHRLKILVGGAFDSFRSPRKREKKDQVKDFAQLLIEKEGAGILNRFLRGIAAMQWVE